MNRFSDETAVGHTVLSFPPAQQPLAQQHVLCLLRHWPRASSENIFALVVWLGKTSDFRALPESCAQLS